MARAKNKQTNAKYLLVVVLTAIFSGMVIWQYFQLVNEEFALLGRLAA